MPRIFVIDEREFPDPDPKLELDQVRQTFVPFFPDLANAEATGPAKRGDDEVYEFKRKVGTKGEAQDYPWIRKWGKYLTSGGSYIQQQIKLARKDGAPATAIYKRETGKWATIDDVTNPRTRTGLGLPPLEGAPPC